MYRTAVPERSEDEAENRRSMTLLKSAEAFGIGGHPAGHLVRGTRDGGPDVPGRLVRGTCLYVGKMPRCGADITLSRWRHGFESRWGVQDKSASAVSRSILGDWQLRLVDAGQFDRIEDLRLFLVYQFTEFPDS
jgi:hypothetical protein